MKIVNLSQRLVILILMMVLGASSAFADQQNFSLAVTNMKDKAGTLITSGSGLVQLIKGDPSHPPTGKATTSSPAFSGGDAYAIFADPANMTNQEIKGKAGDFSGFGAGDGGFAVSNRFDHTMGTAYYVRYWVADGSYYGSSAAQVPWASGLPVPAALAYSVFTLYKAAAPYAPTISLISQAVSTSKNLYPAANQVKTSSVTINFGDGTTTAGDSPIQVKGDASHAAYELRLKTGSAFAGLSDQGNKVIANLASTSASIDLTDQSASSVGKWMADQPAGTTFYAMAVAYNYFGSTASASQSFQLVDLSNPGGVPTGGTATFNLVVGTNTISLPGAGPLTATFTPTGGSARTPVTITPAGARLAIGEFVHGLNTATGSGVTLIGYYDAPTKQHIGLANIGTDGSTTNATTFGKDASGNNYTVVGLSGLMLNQGQALQINIGAAGSLTLSQ